MNKRKFKKKNITANNKVICNILGSLNRLLSIGDKKFAYPPY